MENPVRCNFFLVMVCIDGHAIIWYVKNLHSTRFYSFFLFVIPARWILLFQRLSLAVSHHLRIAPGKKHAKRIQERNIFWVIMFRFASFRCFFSCLLSICRQKIVPDALKIRYGSKNERIYAVTHRHKNHVFKSISMKMLSVYDCAFSLIACSLAQ